MWILWMGLDLCPPSGIHWETSIIVLRLNGGAGTRSSYFTTNRSSISPSPPPPQRGFSDFNKPRIKIRKKRKWPRPIPVSEGVELIRLKALARIQEFATAAGTEGIIMSMSTQFLFLILKAWLTKCPTCLRVNELIHFEENWEEEAHCHRLPWQFPSLKWGKGWDSND